MEPLYLNLDGSVLLHSLRLWHVALDVYISYIYIKFIDCYVYIVIGGVNCGVLTLVSEIRRYRNDSYYYHYYWNGQQCHPPRNPHAYHSFFFLFFFFVAVVCCLVLFPAV